jgi:hypothetical protein
MGYLTALPNALAVGPGEAQVRRQNAFVHGPEV